MQRDNSQDFARFVAQRFGGIAPSPSYYAQGIDAGALTLATIPDAPALPRNPDGTIATRALSFAQRWDDAR